MKKVPHLKKLVVLFVLYSFPFFFSSQRIGRLLVWIPLLFFEEERGEGLLRIVTLERRGVMGVVLKSVPEADEGKGREGRGEGD
jgi:hypothetical protein